MNRRSHRISGLSKAAIKHSGRHKGRRTDILTAGKQNQRQSANDAKRRAIIQGMRYFCQD
jgi:hypothetical protein